MSDDDDDAIWPAAVSDPTLAVVEGEPEPTLVPPGARLGLTSSVGALWRAHRALEAEARGDDDSAADSGSSLRGDRGDSPLHHRPAHPCTIAPFTPAPARALAAAIVVVQCPDLLAVTRILQSRVTGCLV